MPRRRGRTIGTFIVGACVLLLFAHALLGERFRWPAQNISLIKADSAPAERLVTVGTPVLAADGTFVGKVSGLSRDTRGHVGRIRVTPSILIDPAQTPLIIRNNYFSVTDHVIQLNLTVAQLDTMPRAMTEDKEAGSPRLF